MEIDQQWLKQITKSFLHLIESFNGQRIIRKGIMFIHFLLIVCYVCDDKIVSYLNQSSIVDIYNIFMAKDTYSFYFLALFSIFSLLNLILFVTYHLFKINRLVTLSIVTNFIVNLTFMYCLIAAKQVFMNIIMNNLIIAIISLSLSFLPVIIFKQIHLYSTWSYPLILSKSFLPQTFFNVFGIILTFMVWRKYRGGLQKTFLAIISSGMFWSLLTAQINESLSVQVTYLVEWGLFITLVTIFIQKSNQQNEQYLNIFTQIKQCNQNKELNAMNFQIFLSKVQYEGFNRTSSFNKKTGKIDKQFSGQKQLREIRYKQLMGCLYQKINQSVQQKNEILELLIDIKLQMDSDLFQIFKLLQKITTLNLIQIINYIRISIKIQKYYHTKHPLLIGEHIGVKQLSNKVYSYALKINKLIQANFQFWQEIYNSSSLPEDIDLKLQTLVDAKQDAQSQLKSLGRLKKIQKQQKYYQMVTTLSDFYAVNEQDAEYDFFNIKITDYNYLLVKQNNVISDISKGILADMNQKTHNIKGQHISSIIPKQFLQFVEDKIHQTKSKSVLQHQFLIPLVFDSQIILKKASFRLFPHLQDGLRTLIVITDNNDVPGFLYDITHDHFLYFTSEFIRRFQINNRLKEYFYKKFSQQVFSINIAHIDNMFALKSGKQLQLSIQWMNFKKQTTKISQKTRKLIQINNTFDIKAINFYEKDQLKLGIFKLDLSLSKQNKQVIVNDLMKMKGPSKTQNHMKQTQSARYMTQQNKYKGIDDSQEQMNVEQTNFLQKFQITKQKQDFSTTFWISLISFFLASLFIIFLAIYFSISSDRFNSYITLITNGNNLNEQYGNILLMFFYNYLKYHYLLFKTPMLAYNPILNITSMNQFYDNGLLKLISSNLQSQQYNPFNMQIKSQKYNLTYSNFNYTALTNKIDIVSIYQESTKTIDSGNINFFLQNYQKIRSLADFYNIIDIFKQKLSSMMTPANIMFIIIPIFAFIFSVIIYLLIMKTERVYLILINILKKLHKKDIIKIMSRVAEVKQNLKLVALIYEQQQMQSNLLQKFKYLKQNSKKQKRESLMTSANNSQQILTSMQSQQQRQRAKTSEFNIKNALVSIISSYIFIAFVFFYIIMVVYFKINISQEQKDVTSIFQYMFALNNASTNLLTSFTDMLHSSIYFYYFSKSPQFGKTNNVSLASDFGKYNVPSSFNGYKKYENQVVNNDLCILQELNKTPYMAGVKCQTIFNGALSSGYAITVQYYRMSIAFLRDYQISKYYTTKINNNSVQPVFIEIIYTRRLVMQIIAQLKKRYSDTANQFSASLKSELLVSVILLLLASVGLTILLIWHIVIINKKLKRIISTLRAVPKSFLSNQKISKEITHHDLINRIDSL